MATAPKTVTDPIAKVVAVMAEAWRQRVSPATVEAYRIGLIGINSKAIDHAVSVALRTCKFMPSPAELRELAGEQRVEDRAVVAFGVLDSAVKRCGFYRTVDFADKAINAAVHAMGGWERVCDTSDREWDSFFRRRFIDTYCALVRRGISADQTTPCVGYYDRTNGVDGRESVNGLVHVESDVQPIQLVDRKPTRFIEQNPVRRRPDVLRLTFQRP